MFGKKKQTEAEAKETKPQKAKELSPKEIIISHIEQLGPGQSLTYRLAEFLWEGVGTFAIVELNPEYPGKGKKKYIVSTDKMADGKPAGKRSRLWDSDKPKDIAGTLLEWKGESFS